MSKTWGGRGRGLSGRFLCERSRSGGTGRRPALRGQVGVARGGERGMVEVNSGAPGCFSGFPSPQPFQGRRGNLEAQVRCLRLFVYQGALNHERHETHEGDQGFRPSRRDLKRFAGVFPQLKLRAIVGRPPDFFGARLSVATSSPRRDKSFERPMIFGKSGSRSLRTATSGNGMLRVGLQPVPDRPPKTGKRGRGDFAVSHHAMSLPPSKPNVFENLAIFWPEPLDASRWLIVFSESVFDFSGRRAFPLGKNENKWHKSASYTYHTN